MGDIRVYTSRSSVAYQTKSGECHRYGHQVKKVYVCKLHHPGPEELAAIQAALARGETKIAVCRRHSIGTVQRLNRLLAKHPAPPAENGEAAQEGSAPPPSAVPPAAGIAVLTDTEFGELMGELGI